MQQQQYLKWRQDVGEKNDSIGLERAPWLQSDLHLVGKMNILERMGFSKVHPLLHGVVLYTNPGCNTE